MKKILLFIVAALSLVAANGQNKKAYTFNYGVKLLGSTSVISVENEFESKFLFVDENKDVKEIDFFDLVNDVENNLSLDFSNFVDKTTNQTINGTKSFNGQVYAQNNLFLYGGTSTNLIGFGNAGGSGTIASLSLPSIYFYNDNLTLAQSGTKSTDYLRFDISNLTSGRTIQFPDKAGTVAMLDDITGGGGGVNVINGYGSTSTTDASSIGNVTNVYNTSERNEWMLPTVGGIYSERAIADMEDLSSLGQGSTFTILLNTTDAKEYLVWYDTTALSAEDIDINNLYIRGQRTTSNNLSDRVILRTSNNAKVCTTSSNYTYVEIKYLLKLGSIVNNTTLHLNYRRESVGAGGGGGDFVDLTTAQSISGTKTFTESVQLTTVLNDNIFVKRSTDNANVFSFGTSFHQSMIPIYIPSATAGGHAARLDQVQSMIDDKVSVQGTPVLNTLAVYHDSTTIKGSNIEVTDDKLLIRGAGGVGSSTKISVKNMDDGGGNEGGLYEISSEGWGAYAINYYNMQIERANYGWTRYNAWGAGWEWYNNLDNVRLGHISNDGNTFFKSIGVYGGTSNDILLGDGTTLGANTLVDLTTNQSIGGEKTFTAAMNTFNGRLGIGGTPAYGPSRLGDAVLQSPDIDTQSLNFKDNAQNTIAAMFLNPSGTVMTIKGFDDGIMVTDLTSRAGVENTDDAESTIANTIEFTNGATYINDQGVQHYPGAVTPVANAFFQVLQNKGGGARKPYWFGYYDGTTYDPIYTIDTSGNVTFDDNVIVNGVDISKPAVESTGTALNLSNYYQYDMSVANASATYTTTNVTAGGLAEVLINKSGTAPTVTGATQMPNTASFIANTDMILSVKAFGSTVKYWFTEL